MTTAAPARGLTPNASLPAKVPSIPPNQTLYVTNLPSKIQKEDLRTSLYLLFSTYGPVLDVVALKTMAMRGQAHIVYRDIQTSTQAMRHLEGMMFLGRPLKIQYAKSKSHFVAKLDGTFKIPTSTGASNVEQTDLQRSIFDAPAPGAAPAAKLPAKPIAASSQAKHEPQAPPSQGQKRPREDEDEDDDSDVAMEEESDEE